MMGIGASPGIAIGKVTIKKDEVTITKKRIEQVEVEILRFNQAIKVSREEIQHLIKTSEADMGKETAEIFEAHLMMLEDPEFIDQVKDKISASKVNCEWAIQEVVEGFIQLFRTMDNDYIKERIADLKDISGRIIRNLLGIGEGTWHNLDEAVVLITHDLTPSDTASIPKDKVLGLVTELGGATSHTAIMARNLGIPAIVGAEKILSHVKPGDWIIVDGEKGEVFINPDEALLKSYRWKKDGFEKEVKEAQRWIGKKTLSKDGYQVELAGNIGTPNDLGVVLQNDGEGIGLFRSEFLYMNRNTLPSEEEQFEAYRKTVEGMKGKAVIIRTLDIGGDKELPYLNLPKEDNPFLGLRAIRYCLRERDLFKTQLRALLRSSAFGNAKIMFPMISNLQEIKKAKEILEEAKDELRARDLAFDSEIEVGIMIEIPSAAIMSDLLAKEVDFFSIGTNDLLQYTTAVDRMNQSLTSLYSPYHPALLRLVNRVIKNGHNAGIKVGMCGEVAGNPRLVPILLGMGLDEFSMSPSSILRTRKLIASLNKMDMVYHAEKVLNFPDSETVLDYLDKNFNL